MTRTFNLPMGLSQRDLDRAPDGEPCSGGCGEKVTDADKHFETPCGSFCQECMELHLKECGEECG
jgi:hypothetical protein